MCDNLYNTSQPPNLLQNSIFFLFLNHLTLSWHTTKIKSFPSYYAQSRVLLGQVEREKRFPLEEVIEKKKKKKKKTGHCIPLVACMSFAFGPLNSSQLTKPSQLNLHKRMLSFLFPLLPLLLLCYHANLFSRCTAEREREREKMQEKKSHISM